MCGRARCTLNPAQVAAACGLSAGGTATLQMDRYHPSYNASPGYHLPVVRRQGGAGSDEAPVIHCMKWGLVPSFTKKTEKPDHYRMFNARSESIKEKASFRRLIPTNRCLVAAEGFYEWKKDGSRKQPYYVHLKDDRPLVFAALYDSWTNSEDRMPVILGNQSSIDLWLSNSTPKLEMVLEPYDEPDLVWYPVTPLMGKPSFDGPECIKELKSAVETPLLKFFSKKSDIDKSPKEFPGTHASGGAKVEPASAEETEEHNREEKSCKVDGFMPVQKETAELNIHGTKREYEEIATDSGLTAEKFDSMYPVPPNKKGRSIKNVDDKQASLLSYFRKRRNEELKKQLRAPPTDVYF